MRFQEYGKRILALIVMYSCLSLPGVTNLLCAPMAAETPPSPKARASPLYDGTWKGKTSKGRRIVIVVKDHSIATVYVAWPLIAAYSGASGRAIRMIPDTRENELDGFLFYLLSESEAYSYSGESGESEGAEASEAAERTELFPE